MKDCFNASLQMNEALVFVWLPPRAKLSQLFLFVLGFRKMDDKIQSYFAIFVVVSLFSNVIGSYSRDSGEGCTQTRRGCKIENGQCICGVGCYFEYRYNSKSECYKAIKSRESDLCQRNPCRNGGTCSQTSHEPGFKCRCEGTGFYGQRCQYACPKLGVPLQGAFPYECIVI